MFSLIKQSFGKMFARKWQPITFHHIFEHFQTMMMQDHQRAMDLIADLGEKSGGEFVFDRKYLHDSVRELQIVLLRMAKALNLIGSNRYIKLYSTLDRVLPTESELSGRLKSWGAPYVVSLRDGPLDNPELTGGKANTLIEVIQKLRIPSPDGFVITIRAYYRFLEHNNLQEVIRTRLDAWMSGKQSLDDASARICQAIMAGDVPHDLVKAITRRIRRGAYNWSVRSSAYGEDGELSFAGLHQTLLNVPGPQILDAYKMVVASLYSPEAISYRRQMGMTGEGAAMSVLCQKMVDSQASGVLQTVCPEPSDSDCMAIYASFGLGRTAAEGRDTLDQYIVSKEPPHEVKQASIAEKELLLRSAAGGGEEEAALSEDQRTQSAISVRSIRTVAKWAVALERYFKRPLEIEWAVDAGGDCQLLQSRPLKLPEPEEVNPAGEASWSSITNEILLSGKGVVAQGGIGSGVVRIVQSNNDMAEFPDGAVLVTRYTAPWLARIVPKAAAIISERGSVAGHLATIAREFRVPALVGAQDAVDVLRDGMEITLDAHRRVVYEGKVEELIRNEMIRPVLFDEALEFRLLRRILKRVAPLRLIDPQSQTFSPENCQSAHDVIRFVHEKAVQELLELPVFLESFKGTRVWTLESDVPMGLKILDLGGGLDPLAEGNTVWPHQIRSAPLRAFWAGVSRPGTWRTEPVSLDFRTLVSSWTRGWDSGGSALNGVNLAVISDVYMNCHLRLGYHLNVIDARMEEEENQNHIYFRFVGGVADVTRRSRRAQLLADILTHYHFKVTVKGDLVVGRILHLPKEEVQSRLHALGNLVGFTRQIDVQLRDDADIARCVSAFFDKRREGADGDLVQGQDESEGGRPGSAVG